MSGSWRYGVLTAAAILALVLVVAGFSLAQTNRSTQIEINSRQQFINQNIELSRVNQTLVHALAIAAVKNDDPKLRDVLAREDITIHSTAARAASPSTGSGSASNKDHP